jgi:hypothetical protein
MWSWNQFRNLPGVKSLNDQEQKRQYWLHQSNMMLESTINPAAAAAAGAAGGSKKLTDFLIFGLRGISTPPNDYILFNLKKDGQGQPTSVSDIFYGPTVFANNPVDGYKYFISKDLYNQNTSPILFGKIDSAGNITYIDNNFLSQVGGGVSTISFTAAPGASGSYTGLTGSTNGSGYAAEFEVTVTGSTVSSIQIGGFDNINVGDRYKPGDLITINASNFGGTSSDNLLITVDSVKGVSTPTSMYYEGNGNFIVLDRFLFLDNTYDTFPKVVRISTNGTASFVSKHNYYSDSLYPTSLFEWSVGATGSHTWAFASPDGSPLTLIGEYFIDSGEFDLESVTEVVINNVPNVATTKVLFVISAINVNGRVYCNMLVDDKEADETFQCIAELNMQTFEAEYLYPVDSIDSNSDFLYTNIINK